MGLDSHVICTESLDCNLSVVSMAKELGVHRRAGHDQAASQRERRPSTSERTGVLDERHTQNSETAAEHKDGLVRMELLACGVPDPERDEWTERPSQRVRSICEVYVRSCIPEFSITMNSLHPIVRYVCSRRLHQVCTRSMKDLWHRVKAGRELLQQYSHGATQDSKIPRNIRATTSPLKSFAAAEHATVIPCREASQLSIRTW